MVLKFSIEVSEDATVSVIQNATANEKLGELRVNVSFIIGIPPVKQTASAALTTTTPKLDGLFLVFTVTVVNRYTSATVSFFKQS